MKLRRYAAGGTAGDTPPSGGSTPPVVVPPTTPPATTSVTVANKVVDQTNVGFLDGYFFTGNNDSDGKLKRATIDSLLFTYDFRPVAAEDICLHAFPDAVPPGVHPLATPVAASTGMSHAAAVATSAPERQLSGKLARATPIDFPR